MRYNFKLGSDFVPHIALERCLTEISQGSKDFFGLSLTAGWENNAFSMNIENTDANFEKIIMNGSGFWPLSILQQKPSYEYSGFNSNLGQTNEYDIKYSVNIIHKLGCNIFIRDNSLCEFPIHYIIIPGMSQIYKDKRVYENCISQNDANINIMNRLGNITQNDAKILAQAIIHNNEHRRLNDNFLYNVDDDLQDIDRNILLFLLFYFIGEYEMAKKYLDIFLQNKTEKHKYYFAISEYINVKHIKQLNDAEIEHILTNIYGKNIADEIIVDMSNPNKVFQYYDLPTCFNCESCKVSNTCRFFEVVKIQQKINEIVKENYIEQSNVKTVFSNI